LAVTPTRRNFIRITEDPPEEPLEFSRPRIAPTVTIGLNRPFPP
jgi:hypothetical protein